MIVAETLVHRSRIHHQNKKLPRKERSSCELPSSPSTTSSSSSSSIEEEDEIELTEDLIKHCGWWDAHGNVSPHPTICQIGSNSPAESAFATRVVAKCGYDSIDLNCECPSDRVAGRCFGAALMKDQDTAVDIVSSMVRTAAASSSSQSTGIGNNNNNKKLPVSVKTRIGVDDDDSFEFIANFVQRLVDEAGCTKFVIHARKVYMQGLSPAQNRDVPPLDYPRVFRLMNKFPQCSFLINGGMKSLDHARKVAFGSNVKFDDECESGENESESGISNDVTGRNNGDDDHDVVPCQKCNLPQGSCLNPPSIAPPNLRGVMVARLARDRPADLADVDRYFYGEASNPCKNRRELMERYISFLERVYPRRCCDDDQTNTLERVLTPIVHTRPCCNICREFRGQNYGASDGDIIAPSEIVPNEKSPKKVQPSERVSNDGKPQRKQGNKRARRHAKYDGAKIVTRIVDRALQPTWGILAGEPGKNVFRRMSHELSRDKTVRNCGPGYILWKAMKSVSDDVWDKPFELSGGKSSTYYPTK